ncbi:MAG: cell cycle control protein [Lentinula lateritia]|nr:MAG: cell cycle control protein [Lentinula lateritia]
MVLFQRKGSENDESSEDKKEKGGWRRPANTAFKQQRLKAWQPISTPKTVLPTFFILAIIFGPIGGLLIWGSSLVSEMTFDYTDCDTLTPSSSNSSLQYFDIPSSKYSYHLSSSASKNAQITSPVYAFLNNSANSGEFDVFNQQQCVIQFDVPADLSSSVFMYYKLTNFFQNHRRYVKSLDSDQLRGKGGSASDLNNGDCKPLGSMNGKPIYPCGLIANSLFNDTYTNPILLNPSNFDEATNVTYSFSSENIAWPGESKKYVSTPVGNGYDSVDDIVPPPNWAKRFPNGYTTDNIPNLAADEHFQNWMRTAGLPTFSKLYGRNDQDTMEKGRYLITVGLNFPVRPYKGTKSIVISTVSWIGGKNPFLGWAYVAAAALFMLVAVAGTARHLIKPRRLGDMSLLSWNR